jgi:putative membrane protein
MTDAQILAVVAAANEGEVAAGKLASTKATNDSVKAFARDMVTDHSKMLDDGRALAQKLNITPASTAADSLTKANHDLATRLSTAAKGAAFDTMYVNAQVAGHEQVLDMLKNAQSQAQNADLKSMLQSAQGTVQQHLDRIKTIQGSMR